MKSFLAVFYVLGQLAVAQAAQPQADVPPHMNLVVASALDAQINQAVQSGLIPGAVLIVGRNGQVLFRKAYGSRALIPRREPMTLNTIFDAASLTKVTATTPCVMKLFERGKLRLDDPVTKYLPEFQGGKSDITVRLSDDALFRAAPDLDLVPRWSGYQPEFKGRFLTNQSYRRERASCIATSISF